MVDKSIVYITTLRHGVSAEEIRSRYFMETLKSYGYIVWNYRLNVSGLRKYLLYLMMNPPRDLVYLTKKADLVIATSPPLINVIIGYIVAKKHRIPLIVDVRDVWEEYARTSWPLLYRLGIVRKIVGYYYKALDYASKIIVTTDKMRDYYISKSYSPEKIHVIYNGTDPSILKCDYGSREVDLVYLGDFNNPSQAIEFLLYTLKYNDLKLMIIGNGKYLGRVKEIVFRERLRDRIEFTGSVEYCRLARFLCRAKVGVVGRPFEDNPEYLYTIPVKIYDYLAAGLPVAGYGPYGSAYGVFILSNNIGVYIWERNTEKFSRMLIDLVNRSDQFREHARGLALKFDRRRWAKVFADIVNTVVSY